MNKKGTLLNVDDTDALRYAKTRVLEKAGFLVREAATGCEALHLVEEIKPSLVLLDVKLPDMSGIEVCRRIKQSHPSISVLQLSATFVTSEHKVAALDQGADSYLVEPLEPVELVAAVRSLLRLRQTEAKLRESEEFARSVLEASVDCITVINCDGSLEYINSNGLKLLGIDDFGLHKGKAWSTLWSADAWPTIEEAFRRALDGEAPNFQISSATMRGETKWWDVTISPVRTKKGSLAQLVATSRDISEQQRTREAINHLATIVCQSTDAIVSFDKNGQIRSWNHGAAQLLGHTDLEAIGQRVELILPNAGTARDTVKLVESGEHQRFDTQLLHQAGHHVDVSANLAPLRHGDGSILGASAIFRDIRDRKQAEEHVRLLLREVNHRSKNLLTIVQSLAYHTAKGSNPNEFIQCFTNRLKSLSHSQDLIVSGNWVRVPLSDLIQSQLASFGGIAVGRISLRGGPLIINPAAAEGIGMALHELATNAIKHGSLSTDGGKVAIRWTCADGDASRRFLMTWTETGGPTVQPPTHKGFGRRVIEQMAADAVGGEVELRFDPDGVRWTLTAPEEACLHLDTDEMGGA